MQRAFSLLALSITLALTAAELSVPFTSIKAVDVAKANKDRYSFKGYFDDPDGEIVEAISQFGVFTGIGGGNSTLDTITYDPNDCTLLNNDKGIVCKTTGTRLSFKKSKRVPKGAVIEAQKSRNKSSSASSYYTFSGVFRRREFNTSVSTPLSSGFSIDNSPLPSQNMNCTEKIGKRTSKYICTPDTPAPSPV